jgi:hypothetical protein
MSVARPKARRVLSGVFALALLALASGPRSARAVDQVAAACIKANEQAGPLRRAGKLRDARDQLRLCSAATCPVAVRKDCVAGAAQADADVPTVVFSVQDPDGNDLSAVIISLDGQPLADKLDGKALDVDPGEHVFRFESAGHPTVEKRFVIVEGEKNRHERVMLGEPKAAPVAVVPGPAVGPAAGPATENRRRKLGLAVGGGGLVLLVGGGVSALVATLEWTAAKNQCGQTFPVSCKNQDAATSDRSATVVTSTIADIALGVGAAALVTGAVLVIWAPAPESGGAAAAKLTLSPIVGPSASGLTLGGSF